MSDTRNPAQAAEARAAVRQQQRLGAEMARARHAEEAALRPAMAGGIPLRPAPDTVGTGSNSRKKHQGKRGKGSVRPAVYEQGSHDFVAMAPGSGKKKKAQD